MQQPDEEKFKFVHLTYLIRKTSHEKYGFKMSTKGRRSVGTERNSQPQVLLEKKPGVLNEGKRVRVKALKRTLASHKE